MERKSAGQNEANLEETLFALEDHLGAGAILAAIRAEVTSSEEETFSPEARVCLHAFEAMRAEIADILWECGSGRELRAKGYSQDVTLASSLNAYAVALCIGIHGFIQPFTAMNFSDTRP